MLEKTMRMNFLYDFYQTLLTDKQRRYMVLYYLDDYSLGEIAEEFGVSRQAVYDNLKRTESMLEGFEQKLLLYSKYEKRTALVREMKQILNTREFELKEELDGLLRSLENLD